MTANQRRAVTFSLSFILVASAALVCAQATPEVQPTPQAGPQIAFPGQYAPSRGEWQFPVWPSSCGRFAGDERVACLEFVAFDFGRLSRFAAANAALAPASAKESRVVFLGDSITDNWSHLDYSGGFFPGKPYVNRGIGGQTSSQMLLRYRADVIDLKPRVVVILAGTNDISGNSGPMTLEMTESNLATMADLARFHGIKVVFASLLPVCDDKLNAAGQPIVQTKARPNESIKALNRWIAAYAQTHRHGFLDYHSAMARPDGTLNPDLTGDGLHPNVAGYAVMAPLAQRAITEALSGAR
jgi:lysophospholipase L1-like esterase